MQAGREEKSNDGIIILHVKERTIEQGEKCETIRKAMLKDAEGIKQNVPESGTRKGKEGYGIQ